MSGPWEVEIFCLNQCDVVCSQKAAELANCYESAHGFKVGVGQGRRRVNEDRCEDDPLALGEGRTWRPSGPK